MRSSPVPAVGIIALLALASILILPAPAVAEWIGDYYPLTMYLHWSYQNVVPPFDTYTESVFEAIEYEGNPAVRYGENLDEHRIVHSDGQIVTVYAEVFDGVLYDYPEDTVLGEFGDGETFEICPGGYCSMMMIRDWDLLDPAMRQIYQIPTEWDDLILIILYDGDYPANDHNDIVAFDLPGGITPPSGAVSSIDWYQRGLGLVAYREVDPETGEFLEAYDLADYWVAVEDHVPAAAPVVLLPNRPNPFNPATVIPYSLAVPAEVTLTIHDAAGRLVRAVVTAEARSAGRHSASWRGLDDRGRAVPSGVYTVRLEADGRVESRPLTLVR